jgi:hypothetical protein
MKTCQRRQDILKNKYGVWGCTWLVDLGYESIHFSLRFCNCSILNFNTSHTFVILVGWGACNWNITCIISCSVILPILALYSLYYTQKEKHFHTLKTLNPILQFGLLFTKNITNPVHVATANLPTIKSWYQKGTQKMDLKKIKNLNPNWKIRKLDTKNYLVSPKPDTRTTLVPSPYQAGWSFDTRTRINLCITSPVIYLPQHWYNIPMLDWYIDNDLSIQYWYEYWYWRTYQSGMTWGTGFRV